MSEGTAGAIKGGDRLPWVIMAGGQDNFASLVSMRWQVHIYGKTSVQVKSLCDKRDIEQYVFEWNGMAKNVGLKENAVYVIRPDGYVGMAEPAADVAKIAAYLDKWAIGKG